MKAFLIATTVLLAISFVPSQQFSLTGDFITGFESGIFLRSNPKMLEDYGCPEASKNTEQFRQFQAMFQPVKLMGAML